MVAFRSELSAALRMIAVLAHPVGIVFFARVNTLSYHFAMLLIKCLGDFSFNPAILRVLLKTLRMRFRILMGAHLLI